MIEPASTSDQAGMKEHPQTPVGRIQTRADRIRAARGKFAWIPFSSDDHIRQKQEEIKIEERRCDSR